MYQSNITSSAFKLRCAGVLEKTMIQIRLANENDISFLADVERSASIVFHSLPDYDSSGRTVETVLLEKMIEAQKLWVAVNSKDQTVGFIGCRNIDDFLYIHEISVAYDFQKKGIGRLLMQNVLQEAEHSGYPAVGLTTRRDALWNGPFYKSLGFVEVTDAKEWPGLFTQLQKEVNQGANPSIRCAMIKNLKY